MSNIHVSDQLISFISYLPIFFISLGIHEFAHAYTAWRFGDDTAKSKGRLTLNPFKHADLIGTYLMPIASLASGFALIGWAKPVPVNRANFKNQLKDDAVVSFAGPFSNFLTAIVFFILMLAILHSGIPAQRFWVNFFWYGVFLNTFLFAFNLLPIPPLDGSYILFDLFPNKYTAAIIRLGFYGSIILLVFIYSPLWSYFMKIVNLILSLFIKIAGL